MANSSNNTASMVWSYLTLRKAVGVMGFFLPFVLTLGCLLLIQVFDCAESCGGNIVQKSVSQYYHTGMRNIFVGTLCVVGVFLLAYKGYKEEDDREGEAKGLCVIGAALIPTDDRAGDIAGLAAIGVALFPTASGDLTIIGALHGLSAFVFFLMLAYFSLCLFTKTDSPDDMTPKKETRNKLYRVCGYIILAAIVLISLLWLLSYFSPEIKTYLASINPVFWLESVATVAFGISWLTKGEAILQDQPVAGSP